MVDEDHSGEVGTVELEHFLARVCDPVPPGAGQPSASPSGMGDVERYLRGILDPDVRAAEAVACIANDRDVVMFEDVKRFVVDSGIKSYDSEMLSNDGKTVTSMDAEM
mmetsp:Transcript_41863/g.76745  ORF Transcript_41863/g.76745 Transcript_41863/m.76745 type:complete len:108 (-) Transcript_41863:57-380(-)